MAARLRCHYCGFDREIPTLCEVCGGQTQRSRGAGTQLLERWLAERFPTARIARMDADTTSTKWSHRRILTEFGDGEIDVLFGTQMIAKGLDFPGVTLVGVVDADTVVIDNLAGDVLAKSIAAAKATGVIVAFGFAAGPEVTFDIRSLFFEQKQLKGTMASDKSDMELGLKLVKEGKVRPLLDRTLPLRDAATAHELIANNDVAGNIVLLPWAA